MFSKEEIKKINSALVVEFERLETLEDSEVFWTYLLRNNLANYYIAEVGSENFKDNRFVNEINSKAKEFSKKHIDTLDVLHEISEKEGLDFALFKTVREFNEIADGDIDFVVRENDFELWVKALETSGFECFSDGKLQVYGKKKGLMKVEPRVNITTYKSSLLLDEENIWKNTEKVVINDKSFLRTSNAVDLYALLLNFVYGPKYVRLYELKLLRSADTSSIKKLSLNETIEKDLDSVIERLLEDETLLEEFPYFWDASFYLGVFKSSVLKNKDYDLPIILRQLAFFFYIKYEYRFFGKLHFEHKWL